MRKHTKMVKYHITKLLACVFICLYHNTIHAQVKILSYSSPKDSVEENRSVYLKGFVQADIMVDFQSIGSRDGFAANSIRVPQENNLATNFSVRQSQLGLEIRENSELSAYVEIDFFGPNNTTAPRFRKGYIQWKGLLIGQTWSNFADIDIFPNIFDFAGPNGTLFTRLFQIRYSAKLSDKGNISFSLEDPSIKSFSAPESWTKKNMIPSLTSVYRYGGERDYIKLGGMISPTSYQTGGQNQQKNKTIVGWAGMISARKYVGIRDNLRTQISYGKGYTSHNIVLSGEKYDAAANLETQKLENTELFSITGIYEHWWTPQWGSVVYYSFSDMGNNTLMSRDIPGAFQNMALNIVYQPLKKLRMDIEGNYGKVKNFSGQQAGAWRIQSSIALSF